MKSTIEIYIRECETRLYAAMLASNVDELNALIADDLLFTGSTGELATKEMDLELGVFRPNPRKVSIRDLKFG